MDAGKAARGCAAELAMVLRREIADGVFQHGDRLPTGRQMAETYGAARGTVRAALLQLAEDGLIETRPGSGSYVTAEREPPANRAILEARPLELIDARFALEPHICRLAVLHARASDLDEAERLLEVMEASSLSPKTFSEADTAFHTLLARATGNGLLCWMLSEISSVRHQDQWALMLSLTLTPETITTYNAEHRAIVDAIRERVPERAAGLMKQHLETARLSLTRVSAT